MALRECRECGSKISTGAKTCPHCGIESPARTPLDGINEGIKEIALGLIGLCIVLGVIVVVVSSREEAKTNEQAEQQCLKEHPLPVRPGHPQQDNVAS
jgi:zinc-ribbon domain